MSLLGIKKFDEDEFLAEISEPIDRSSEPPRGYTSWEEMEVVIDRMACSCIAPGKKSDRLSPAVMIDGGSVTPVIFALSKLEEFVEVGKSHEWLLSPNSTYFAGQRPVDALAEGIPLEELLRYIELDHS